MRPYRRPAIPNLAWEPAAVTCLDAYSFQVAGRNAKSDYAGSAIVVNGVSTSVVTTTYNGTNTIVYVSDPVCFPGMAVARVPKAVGLLVAAAYVGNMTASGGLAAAFDGVLETPWAACCRIATSISGYGNTAGCDWGASVTRTITRVRIFGCPEYEVLALSGAGTSFNLEGSANNSAWTTLGSGSIPFGKSFAVDVLTGFTQTAYRYHRVNFAGNGSNSLGVAEIEFYGY